MTYSEAVQKIEARLRFGSRPGLERIAKLCHALGDPQNKLKVIHVAGTNGKGTTCTLISYALKEAGYTVGLYTSPYVVEFRERFQINNELIPEHELIDAVEKVSPIADELEKDGEPVTEFEFITAMAFYWFQKRGCDYVVLEVGLGGRFDATNIIPTPLAAVIASISLDHTKILGDTVEKIAFEKAGIIKPGGEVIAYADQPGDVLEVFRTACAERGANLTVADPAPAIVESTGICGSRFTFANLHLFIPFTGEHQIKNAVTALYALFRLRAQGVFIPDEAIEAGFCHAAIPARMEVLHNSPTVLIDGGHNPGCAQALRQVLMQNLSDCKMTAIMGMMADKDTDRVLSILAPLFARVFTVTPDNPRSLPAEELAQKAAAYCPDCRAFADKADAVRTALRMTGRDDAIIICGSFYMAGDMRRIVAENMP